MLTEVIWRVNVHAMRNPQNPVVCAHYRHNDAFLGAESVGILAVKGTPPPRFFCKRVCKVMKTKDRGRQKSEKSAKSPQPIQNKEVTS
jgi:hypothetical protein